MNKLDKAINSLDDTTVAELISASKEELKQRIVQADKAMQQAQQELEDNKEYQAMKEGLKALTEGKRAVNKRQKAIIFVAIHRLNELEE